MKHLFAIRYSIALCAILFFAGIVRLFQLGYPAEFVFDERYHVPAIKLIAEHDERAFEWWHPPLWGEDNHDWLHPPLAKYIQAQVYSWGQGSVESWRLASVVFGLAGIIGVYVFASLITADRTVGLLSAFSLSMNGIWLVQSRVAMNDIFVSVWLLFSALLYVLYRQTKKEHWLFATGILLGCALATKWTGAFFIGGFLFVEAAGVFLRKSWRTLPWKIFCLGGIPLFLYFLSYVPVLFQGKDLAFLWQLHTNIIWYQLHRDALHPAQSIPAEWITTFRPLWYWQGTPGATLFLMNNPLLFFAEVWALWATVVAVWKKKSQALSLLLFFYSISFVPWVLSPRILFLYHITPALPFIAVMVGYWTKKLYLESPEVSLRILLWVSLVLLVSVFWICYPFLVGFPVSQTLQQTVYFLLKASLVR